MKDPIRIASLVPWLAELADASDLVSFSEHLLPELLDTFGASLTALEARHRSDQRLRVAAYAHEDNRLLHGRTTVQVSSPTSDSFWKAIQQRLATAKASRQRIVLLGDGSLVLRLESASGGGSILLGPRRERPYSLESQDLAEMLALHLGSLLETRLLNEAIDLDPFTGTLSRDAVFEDLAAELERAGRQHHPVSLALIELDALKEVRERFGAQLANELWQQAARQISQHLETQNSVGRYAGNGLMIVLPATPLTEASRLVKKIQAAVAEVELPVGDGLSIGTTLSAGVLALEYGTDRVSRSKVSDLVDVADFALRQAKEQGGNGVQKWSWRQPEALGLN